MTTLLLVEDDVRIALALRIRLESAGYVVVVAPDAVHAMDRALRHRPDVALLDVGLPGGDGFLVAERLRTSAATAATPIVFVTASKRPELRARAAAVAAFAFVEKPFSAAQMLDTLDGAVASGAPRGLVRR